MADPTRRFQTHEVVVYTYDDGSIIMREEFYYGSWVLKNHLGNVVDKDTYRHDLMERNNIQI